MMGKIVGRRQIDVTATAVVDVFVKHNPQSRVQADPRPHSARTSRLSFSSPRTEHVKFFGFSRFRSIVKKKEMTETMQLRGTLRGHNGWVTQIATNPIHTDMILSCSRGKRTRTLRLCALSL